MSDKNNKSNIVKDVCGELGVNQKELAVILGVQEDTVSNWSTKKTPTPKWFKKISSLLIKEQKYEKLKEALNQFMS